MHDQAFLPHTHILTVGYSSSEKNNYIISSIVKSKYTETDPETERGDLGRGEQLRSGGIVCISA